MLIETRGLVHNYSGLLACRFFLGLVEGTNIATHHSLHSSDGQVVSFLALFSISLFSILASGYKYGIREIIAVFYKLTFFLELQFFTRQHHYRVLSPDCWPLPLTISMERVASPGGLGYSSL